MTIKERAFTAAAVATTVTILLVIVGSRGLRDFDAALIGYAVDTVCAIAAVNRALALDPVPPRHYRRNRTSAP